MNPMRVISALALLASVTAGLTSSCARNNAAPGTQPQQAADSAPAGNSKAPGMVRLGASAPELKQMSVEEVKAMPVPSEEVLAPARIAASPNRIGHAVLPAPGRIVRVLVKLGDTVRRGQQVVTLESPAITDLEFSYSQAETGVRQAELAVAKAEADVARLTDLLEHQAVAQKEVLAARTTLGLSKSALDQAQGTKAQAKRRLELLGLKAGEFQQQITVSAPVAGKVLEVNVVDGEFRNEINTPLVTIADLSRVWATSDVPESKIRYCQIGGQAHLELIAFPNQMFHARVTRIADTVDSDTRTIQVSAELDNSSGRLLPQMFGSLRYADGLVRLPWVPEAAIVRIDGKDFVFVETATGEFRATAVELGKNHDRGFAVSAGVKPGDRIVTQGAVYLKAAL